MPFIPLKNLLPQALRNNKIEKQILATKVLEEFDKIAKTLWGEVSGQELKAMYVKDRILTVAVLSSTIASEIKLYKTKIISELNQAIGQNLVKDIRIIY